MGAALLLHWKQPGAQQDAGALFETVADGFPARVRAMSPLSVAGRPAQARVWSHGASRSVGLIEDSQTGSWLALVGNPTRRDLAGASGDELLARLLDDCLSRGPESLDSVSPPFAAVFYDGRSAGARAVVDRFGFQHLYLREGPGGTVWISSSSLALASAFPSTLDPDALAEWLGVGNFISGRTFFSEIRKLGPGEQLALDGGGARTVATWEPVEDGRAAQADQVQHFVDSFLESLEACTGRPGTATELTGGIDSRLLLAGLLELGVPFFGWTVAHRHWSELRTIEKLHRRAEFEHVVAEVTPGFADRIPELVAEMHELTDGESNALAYAHLIVAFEQLAGRRATSLSGVAGEIARGFYYSTLAASPRDLRGVSFESVVSKTTRPTRMLHGRLTDALPDPREAAGEAIREFMTSSPMRTPVGVLEDLYLRGRLQRFAGRNFTMTGHFCSQGLPYHGNAFVDLVFGLPVQLKEDGLIVRRALQRLGPELARAPLAAGALVAPTSPFRLDALLRRSLALGRKGAARYGGPLARRLLARSVENLPGHFARGSSVFREYARELLLGPEARIGAYVPPAEAQRVLDAALGGASLYPLGLLLTTELTLRRANLRPASP